MSDSYWRRKDRISGLLIAVMLGSLLGLGLLPYRHQHKDQREKATAIDTEQAVAACRRGPEDIPDFACIIESQKAEYEKKHTAADLRAQQEMAEWSALMVWVTAIGVIYLALTLDATREAVREAKDATKAAQDAVAATMTVGKIQSRAYLLVERVQFGFPDPQKGGQIIAAIINRGQTPAVAVAIRADVIYPSECGPNQTGSEVIARDLGAAQDFVFQYDFPNGALPEAANSVSKENPWTFTVIIRLSYETAFGVTEHEKYPFSIQYLRQKEMMQRHHMTRVLTEAERARYNERQRVEPS